MPQSQRLLSVIPFTAIGRPACPKCKAPMMLVRIEPARAQGVDLHTFECTVCNLALSTISNEINHKYEKPKAAKRKQKVKQSLPPAHHGSCPIRKSINDTVRNAPQLTKSELYNLLATAVRNTTILRR